MFVEGFPPSAAYPISTFLIAVTSLCTFYICVTNKNENAESPLINYNFAILFCPVLLLGTKIGIILNKSLSSLLLTILLFAFILNGVKKIHSSAVKQKEKEYNESLIILNLDGENLNGITINKVNLI